MEHRLLYPLKSAIAESKSPVKLFQCMNEIEEGERVNIMPFHRSCFVRKCVVGGIPPVVCGHACRSTQVIPFLPKPAEKVS